MTLLVSQAKRQISEANNLAEILLSGEALPEELSGIPGYSSLWSFPLKVAQSDLNKPEQQDIIYQSSK